MSGPLRFASHMDSRREFVRDLPYLGRPEPDDPQAGDGRDDPARGDVADVRSDRERDARRQPVAPADRHNRDHRPLVRLAALVHACHGPARQRNRGVRQPGADRPVRRSARARRQATSSDTTSDHVFNRYGCSAADDRCQDDRHDAVARRRGAGTAAGVVGCIDGVEWFRDATHLPTAVSHQAIQRDWFPSVRQHPRVVAPRRLGAGSQQGSTAWSRIAREVYAAAWRGSFTACIA
ncbi:MAG: hypothetical protein QOJ47_2252 [Gaiellales bacterium]|nr:hypothetical protein [Gaiellales bacterium]